MWTPRPAARRCSGNAAVLATAAADRTAWRDEGTGGFSSDRNFAALHGAYKATGGMAKCSELARLLEDRPDRTPGDVENLAELIDRGAAFGFDWKGTCWVPLFQFNLWDLSTRPGSRQVLAELSPSFDGWQLAAWFVQRSAWLDYRRPVDLLSSNLPAVLSLARVDRYVANG